MTQQLKGCINPINKQNDKKQNIDSQKQSSSQNIQQKISSKIIDKRVAWKGKWIEVFHTDYSIGDKIIKNYESAQRTTKTGKTSFDGVTIIPILTRKQKQENCKQQQQLLLAAVYRPAVQNFVLDFPAGLVETDNIFDDVQRELVEETGYTANSEIQLGKQLTSANSSPVCYLNAGITNDSGKIISVEIDLDNSINQNPKQKLEETENIYTHIINLDENVLENLQNLLKTHQYDVGTRVMSFIQGYLISQKFKN